MTAVSDEWIDKHGRAWDQADKDGTAFVKELKKEIITLSPEEQKKWVEKVQPVIDDYVTKTAAKKLPGKQFLDDLRAAIQKNAAQPTK